MQRSKKNITSYYFRIVLIGILPGLIQNTSHAQQFTFPWLAQELDPKYDAVTTISTPDGYSRVKYDSLSFAIWLRSMPLKTTDNQVYLYNGHLKPNQAAHYRVLNIDVGARNLQQCADAIIRLRAEYLYSQVLYEAIAFNFTSGDRASFNRWIEGFRPQVKGNKVKWDKPATTDSSYQNFRTYLNTVFAYAGSYSLSKELQTVDDINQIQAGDVFIEGGFPGHAVIVVDVALSNDGEKTAMLLAQSYMPAQEMHILNNPQNPVVSPWYIINETSKLITPEWTFRWSDLKRFR